MNYYIEANPDKAEQIKAAFKSKGYTTNGWNYNGKCGVYFTNETDKTVDFTHIEPFVNLIKTHPNYQELKLPIEYKDGDIIGFNDCIYNSGSYVDWIGIYKQRASGANQHLFHCVITSERRFRVGGSWKILTAYPATQEQRDLLFAKMKEAGYEWDADKKELRKIQPHYDIANFKVGMPVLARDYDNSRWSYVQFSHYVGECGMKFNACGIPYIQCIPFEGNEHLLGTTDMPSEEYINW